MEKVRVTETGIGFTREAPAIPSLKICGHSRPYEFEVGWICGDGTSHGLFIQERLREYRMQRSLPQFLAMVTTSLTCCMMHPDETKS